jgi:hypothetical protein
MVGHRARSCFGIAAHAGSRLRMIALQGRPVYPETIWSYQFFKNHGIK